MKEVKRIYTIELTKDELNMIEIALYNSCWNIRESIRVYEADADDRHKSRIPECKKDFKEHDKLRKEICKSAGVHFQRIKL